MRYLTFLADALPFEEGVYPAWDDPFGGFGFNNTDEIFIGEEEGYIV